MLNLGLGFNSTQDYNPAENGRYSPPTLGRVYDIVLDENHPSYEATKTIGPIRYNLFDEDNFEEKINEKAQDLATMGHPSYSITKELFIGEVSEKIKNALEEATIETN